MSTLSTFIRVCVFTYHLRASKFSFDKIADF